MFDRILPKRKPTVAQLEERINALTEVVADEQRKRLRAEALVASQQRRLNEQDDRAKRQDERIAELEQFARNLLSPRVSA